MFDYSIECGEALISVQQDIKHRGRGVNRSGRPAGRVTSQVEILRQAGQAR